MSIIGAMIYLVFFVLFVIAVMGVWAENNKVEKRISEFEGKAIKPAYTHKRRMENLELYRKIAEENHESLFWYHFLAFCYKKLHVAGLFLLVFAAIFAII